jgi:hypothetical protein
MLPMVKLIISFYSSRANFLKFACLSIAADVPGTPEVAAKNTLNSPLVIPQF